MKFARKDDKGRRTYRTTSGTGSLVERLSKDTFVLVSAAHNFLEFESKMEKSAPKEAVDVEFFLQRNGEESRAEFDVEYYIPAARYTGQHAFLHGADIAVAAVKVRNPEQIEFLDSLALPHIDQTTAADLE